MESLHVVTGGRAPTFAPDVAAAARDIQDTGHPAVFGLHQSSAPSMVGVARLTRSDVAGLWEQHPGGDELLLPLNAAMTVVLRVPDGSTTRHRLCPGSLFIVPQGVPHSFELEEAEIQLLFVTPRDGNLGWSDDGREIRRHS